MDNRNIAGVYEQHKQEKAKRRGVGFVGFLSDLDWMLSLEIEEGKPLDETKITTAQKFHTFSQGIAFGLSVHTPVLFIVSSAFYLLLYATPELQNKIGSSIIFLLTILFSLSVKVLIPKWLIDDYYIFPKGITYTYLSWFLGGYSLGLFIPEFIYFLGILFFMGMFNLVDEPMMYYDWWYSFSEFVKVYLSHFVEFKWLPLHFFMLILTFFPIYLLKRHRKKHPFEKKKWMPLDFVPEDDK